MGRSDCMLWMLLSHAEPWAVSLVPKASSAGIQNRRDSPGAINCSPLAAETRLQTFGRVTAWMKSKEQTLATKAVQMFRLCLCFVWLCTLVDFSSWNLGAVWKKRQSLTKVAQVLVSFRPAPHHGVYSNKPLLIAAAINPWQCRTMQLWEPQTWQNPSWLHCIGHNLEPSNILPPGVHPV